MFTFQHLQRRRSYMLLFSGLLIVGLLMFLFLSNSISQAGIGGVDPMGPGHQITNGQQSTSLNGEWRFATDPADNGETNNYHTIAFNDSGWDPMTVPSNWNVYDDYANYEGVAWYRRTFAEPTVNAGEVARLRFEAVFYETDVWFNDTYLGRHTGGYTPFEFDVTALLQPTNTVAVRADNLDATGNVGAWYSWGGISRDVSLTVDPAVRIERQKIDADPDLVGGTAAITTTVTISNSSAVSQTVQIAGQLTETDGQLWAPAVNLTPNGSDTMEIGPGASANMVLTATLAAGTYDLWHFDDPNLYRAEVSLLSPTPYTLSDRFGIRKIELQGTGFYLNGEQVRLNGFNRVSDDRVNGYVEPVYMVRRDMDRMKAAGANMTRIMHHAQSPDLLDYADEKGMLLIEEVPAWGKSLNLDVSDPNSQFHRELNEMIPRDWNHPSIFAWSVANEISANSNAGRTFVSTLMNHVRTNLDDTRLLTFASNTVSSSNEASQYSDFVSTNYYGNFRGQATGDHALFPSKPLLITEYSPDGYNFQTSRETLDHTTGTDTTLRVWDDLPWMMGASIWTFNDYRSTYSGTSINQVRGWGVQDVWGGVKRGYAEVQSAYAPVNSLEIVASGNNGGTTMLRVTPRAGVAQELPAHTLNGYSLVWQAVQADGQLAAGRILPLGTINLGDPVIEKFITWTNSGGQTIVEEQVTLLSPTGYEVAVAKTAVSAPNTPAITQHVAADGSVRVVFDHVAGATSYRLEAVAGAETHEDITYRHNFIDLTGLTNDTTYQLNLYAVNAAGESAAATMSFTPNGSDGELPPIVQAAIPVQNGFAVGFIVNSGEDSWDIEVFDTVSNTTVQSYNSAVKGASRVDGLTSDRDYRVRVRGVSGATPTEWSQWLDVRTLGPSSIPETPAIVGVLAGETTIGVRITPHPFAEYYTLTYTPDGGSPVQETFIGNAIELLTVDGLTANTDYTLQVAVHTATGSSVASAVQNVSTLPTSPPPSIGTPTGLANNTVDGNVILSWNPVAGAEGYIVFGEGLCQTILAGTTPQVTLGHSSAIWGNYSVAAVIGEDRGSYSTPLTIISSDVLIIVDNDHEFACSNGANYVEAGGDGDPWAESGLLGHDGSTTRYSSQAGKTATWTTPYLPTSGRYEVDIWYPNNGSSTQNAEYTITYADAAESDGSAHELVVLNQRNTGGVWRRLGTWHFNAGESGIVELEVVNGTTRADAVRFRYVGGTSSELVMDNADGTGITTQGTWSTSTYVRSGYENFSFYGANALTDGNDGTKVITYTPSIPTTGYYKVLVRWTAWGWNDRATNVPLDINHVDGTFSTTVDQNNYGGIWVPFGIYQFDAGTLGSVVVSNEGTTGSRQVTADAVRFVGLDFGVALSADDALQGEPNEVVTYTVTLTNTGDAADTYTIAISDTWGATAPASVTG